VASREGVIEAGGVRVRYVETGAGPALVHLHGAGAPADTRATQLLAGRFRVIALELPDRAPLGAALASLDLDAASIVTTSAAGATAALRCCLEAPARVAALVLVAPAAAGDDLDRRLPAVNTPTVVLVGTRDTETAAAAGRHYAERIPGAHLVFVYDSERDIAGERPEAFADIVADFFERREAFVISRTESVIHP
jgi:pimeloyl-ACP methyl ester carboxylesterase